MPFNLLGQPTTEAVNNSTVFLLPPGQITFEVNGEQVSLVSGQDYVNPGTKADGTKGTAYVYQKSSTKPKPKDDNDGRTISEGTDIAKSLYAFLPPEVVNEYAKNWVKSGDANVAMGMTRQTKPWKDNFGKLMRDDGTLIMDELSFIGVKASYKQTLSEVGINDFSDFEDEFDDMATGYGTDDPVSAEEFQTRIDMVYAGVKDQIPAVERLFRQRYNIDLDEPTIFGALINPKIQDKVLAGDIATLQLQAQATSRGFTTTFARFQELRRLGLTTDAAKGLYEGAGSFISQAKSIGRDLDISTLESATIGDTKSQQRINRIQAEIQSSGGLNIGAAKKGDEVIGLTEN